MERKRYQQLVEETKKTGIQRFIVGAVILCNKKVLLLERPKDDFMGGIYELPSGKVEDDEELDKALYREVLEETGLIVKEVLSILPHFNYLSGNGKKTRQFNFLIEVTDAQKIALTEHERYAWIGKNELSKYNITDKVKRILAAIERVEKRKF